MNFKQIFKNCKTIEEIKKLYKKLSKEYHPDLGGDTEIFKELLSAYETAIKMFSYENFKAEFVSDYMIVLQRIVDLDIEIEIIGNWIYCFKAFSVKDFLKGLGFWFSSKHKAWIYNGGMKQKRRSNLSLSDIEHIHGCEKIKSREKIQIA